MFAKCKTVLEIKTLYRRLALHLHPDHGGDNELMALLVESMEAALEAISEANPLLPEGFEETKEPVFQGDFRILLLPTIVEFCSDNGIEPSEFIISVKEYYTKKKYVTIKQYNALLRIYNSLKHKGIEDYWNKMRPAYIKAWNIRS